MNWHGVDLNWAYADLLGGIRRRTGCIHRSYDILHDSLIRLALVDKREPIQQPHAYLRTVVRSVLADGFRDESRWVALPDAEEDGDPDSPVAEFSPSAETMAQLRERLRATQRMLDRLPPRRREVFWLFRIEGYSQIEIAARLGLAAKTVENHVMRVLIELRTAEERMS